MLRGRPLLGLVFALLVWPRAARGDGFVPPPDKTAVEVTIAIENLDAHPGYLFVLWPDGCLHNPESLATYTVLNVADDDGRTGFWDEGCNDQRLFAFPADTYAAVEGVLPENAAAQLRDDPPTDPRVLVTKIDAEELWWVPDEVGLVGIEDVYRVAIDGGALTLTPTRVRFDFGDRRIWERAFHKGRRPRLPRPQDVPPAPAAAPATANAAGTVEAPGEAAPPLGASPAPSVAAPPPVPEDSPSAAGPPAAADPAPAPAPREISPEPWPPPALLYGGLCLLVALGAGLGLRRRG